MPDDDPDSTEANPPEGVFGNLPKARPGVRSPRRDGETQDHPPPPPKPVAAKRLAPKPPPAPEAPPARESTPAQAAAAGSTQIKGVEDLAWAGIAIAAEAATAGVRFASKALEAARKSIDRP